MFAWHWNIEQLQDKINSNNKEIRELERYNEILEKRIDHLEEIEEQEGRDND